MFFFSTYRTDSFRAHIAAHRCQNHRRSRPLAFEKCTHLNCQFMNCISIVSVSSECLSEQSLPSRVRYGSTSSLSSAATASSPCAAGMPVSPTSHLSPYTATPSTRAIWASHQINRSPFSLCILCIVAVGNDNINFACDNDFKYNIKYINIVAVAEAGPSIQPELGGQPN